MLKNTYNKYKYMKNTYNKYKYMKKSVFQEIL